AAQIRPAGRRNHRRRRRRAPAARAGSDLLSPRRKGARRQDRRAAQMGRPIFFRHWRRRSAVPARAGLALRGDPGDSRRHRVAGLREHLRWFDARPLFGRRVLVTRPRDEAAELVDRLETMGAEAVEAPMIRILPPEDTAPLDAACRDVASYDAVVFASPRAV